MDNLDKSLKDYFSHEKKSNNEENDSSNSSFNVEQNIGNSSTVMTQANDIISVERIENDIIYNTNLEDQIKPSDEFSESYDYNQQYMRGNLEPIIRINRHLLTNGLQERRVTNNILQQENTMNVQRSLSEYNNVFVNDMTMQQNVNAYFSTVQNENFPNVLVNPVEDMDVIEEENWESEYDERDETSENDAHLLNMTQIHSTPFNNNVATNNNGLGNVSFTFVFLNQGNTLNDADTNVDTHLDTNADDYFETASTTASSDNNSHNYYNATSYGVPFVEYDQQ